MARDLIDEFYPEERGRKDGEELTVHDVLCDFKRSFEAKKALLDECRQDHEFALGKQWDEEDVRKLEKVGVRALTLNKIAPNLALLKGIESQNRSDFRAYPEGEEDTLASEIVTRLMKNVAKQSNLNFYISDMFEAGNTCGEAFLEPWLHYPYKVKPDGTVDLTATLKFKLHHYDTVYEDPSAKEYDLSDAQYLCKFTSDLTKEQLISMFPDKKEEIEELEEGGKINIDAIQFDRDQMGIDIQRKDYPAEDSHGSPWMPKGGFDLLDYYYQKYVPKYYVADFKLNQVRLAKNKKQAENYVKKATERDGNSKKPSARIIERLQPEMWVAFLTGGMDDFLAHGPAWSFPRWQNWPLFGYYCYKSSAPLEGKDRHFLVQGITRRVKDNQREHNKRRTQELRHLNQSANSGWQAEEGQLVDEDKWETFGSSPGVVLKRKAGTLPVEKILPTPLSQGHAQLAGEHQQDMRDALGIDREALALQSDQASGRAILARQKQGMVMVQPQFDNLARTKGQIGRFMLAQLPELYDIEKAKRVLGQAFLQKNFLGPVMDPATGQPAVNPMTGEPITQYDDNLANETINQVLNDAELGVFDVAVGENISTETIQMAEYSEVRDMAQAGIPVPPDVIVEASTISEAKKRRIISAFAAAQSAAPQKPQPKKGGK